MRTTWLRVALLAVLALPACSAQAGSAPPDDQVVFQVGTAGGMMPPIADALSSPALVIYGDGRVLTKVNSLAIQFVPARYDIARIDPSAVASFTSSAEQTVNPDTDFGTPPVTDVGSTTVTVNGRKISVYAFDATFESGLTPAQRHARAALRSLIDRAYALSGGAARASYTPDRVVVYELDSHLAQKPATVGWPGPPPATFLTAGDRRRWIACGDLVADPAEMIYRAALDNPGAGWLVDGVTRILAVNPLPAPGACP